MSQFFERYKTVAFDAYFMRSLIAFGSLQHDRDTGEPFIDPRGNALVIALWLDFVPLAYRADAERIAVESMEPFIGKVLRRDGSSIALWIGEFQARWWREIDYRWPGEETGK